MRVLLIGECYSDNLGDGVICETVVKILTGSFDITTIDFLDLSGRIFYNTLYINIKKKYTFTERVKAFSLYRFDFILRNLSSYRVYIQKKATILRIQDMLKYDYDIAIFVGGSLFQDYFIGVIYHIVKALNKKNIPVIFNACGMSHLNCDSDFILRKILNLKCIKSISLRDHFEYFKMNYRTKAEVINTFDIAFNCRSIYKYTKTKSNIIGIGVISGRENMEFIKKIIVKIDNRNREWKLFTNGSIYDYKCARQILEELNYSRGQIKDYLQQRPKRPNKLVENISQFELIISFRMHSQIIAATLDIPCIAISWDKKIQYLFEKLGYPERCINISISPEKILNQLDDVINSSYIAGLIEKHAQVSKDCLIKQVRSALI